MTASCKGPIVRLVLVGFRTSDQSAHKSVFKTAEHVTASVAVDKEELHIRINALAHDPDTSFRLTSITYHEVLRD